MFQKKIIEKYLSKIDRELLIEKYALYRSVFANKEKQENIRNSKEEQYQEGFIRDLFCSVLGYTIKPEANYNILTELKNESKSNSKKTDGAIIINDEVKAVIELKGTDTQDLDKVAFQAFSYKNHHEKCNYVIVSNFERLRLYVETQIEFTEFNLFNLSKESFDLLFLLLHLENITNDIPLKLKHETLSEEKEITNNFYADYSTFKRALFEDLCDNNPDTDKLLLFKKTQKLLDRILFILFCEDRNLLPTNSTIGVINDYKKLKELGYYQPLYNVFKTFFDRIDKGFKHDSDKSKDVFAYNGGLFKPDETLDTVKVSDDVLYIHTKRLSNYDFESQISVDILGRIFENSLTEIEEVQNEIENEKNGIKTESSNIGKRKKDGVFYTPEYITRYIVENTIGTLCEKKRTEFKINDNEYSVTGKKGKAEAARLTELENRLEDYRKWLLSLKILDPACGSGAFLNAALKKLRQEHTLIDYYHGRIRQNEMNFSEIDNAILENNIYGVDINEESVEIAKLSLWLSTAKRNRKLSTLANNIKCGNSLISDLTVVGEKAFNWKKEFPEVFEKGGFDVVIGNPPYVQLQTMGEMSEVYAKCGYKSYNKSADLYCLFAERGYELLKDGGLLSYIMPNKWMVVDYGKELRSFLSKTNLRQILNFGDIQFFKDATTYVCIFVTQNSGKNESVQALSLNQKTYHGNFLAEIPHALQNFDAETFAEEPWIIRDASHTALLKKMESCGFSLKELPIEINYGIKTGYNDAFFINGEIRKKLIEEDSKSADLIQPLFRGRDITAWTSTLQELYLIGTFPALKLDIEQYPVIKEHLLSFGKERLEQSGAKGARKKTSNAWFETQDQISYYESFKGPKIIYPNMTSAFPFCYDESGAVCNDKAFIITSKTHTDGNLLKVLVAIFNSPLTKLWIWYNCPELQGGTREIRKAYFENFPVPDLTKPQFSTFNSQFSALADKMLTLNAEVQKKVTRFISRIKETYSLEKTTQNIESFYTLCFADFVKELSKQKVKLSLKQKDELEDYFNEYVKDITAINETIVKTDKEINSLVYSLYNLTDEEIIIIEN